MQLPLGAEYISSKRNSTRNVSALNYDLDVVLDKIAGVFAASASSEIKAAVRQVLDELVAACNADGAVLLRKETDKGSEDFHAFVASQIGLPPETWIRRIYNADHNSGEEGCFELLDWRQKRGKVYAQFLDGGVLILRWNRYSITPWMQDIPTLMRRAGALMMMALKREDLAQERCHVLRQLSESQQLDVAGATAVAMAHNLNNVLAAMRGQTEIALEALRDKPSGYEAVMAIRNASERAAELIESILSFGQSDIPSSPMNIGRMVLDTINFIRPTVPRRIRVALDDQGGGAYVYGRAAELQQVVLNLLRNAVQAIAGDGDISIRLRQQKEAHPIDMQVGLLEDKPYLVMEVEDTGVGIDPSLYESIFRPFYTTRTAGSGLGLSTVAEIVVGHNGALRLAPAQQGKGTLFEVWLPICERNGARIPVGSGEGETVWVVAQNPVRERLEDVLAALGYEPCGYEGVNSALEVLAEDPLLASIVLVHVDHADLDCCFMVAERFRSVSQSVLLVILIPGRMAVTPLDQHSDQLTWLVGSDNNAAIAACMRLVANALANKKISQGAIK
ncbi:ATP-binding protein [Swingsia samuiensis]|uniref:histidine kinase n=1 Tax=Swingsia samuiensis TaxID=1293412 RepID=A0A4Y6UIL9_9PROT|nr:ATP-binding protein [Swingsia samuiensis]QDH16316.1 hypothetical protein E3D00_01050 [Swingsia samuiensis]